MFFSSIVNTLTVYTPLEQFDEVIWLSNSVFSAVEASIFSVLEREYSANERYTSSIANGNSLFSTASGSFQLFSIAFLFVGFRRYSAFISNESLSEVIGLVSNRVSYSPIALIAVIHLLTGTFFTLWFADFYFPNETIGTERVQYLAVPQIVFSFGIDEIRITFVIAFFLLGGGETEDDEDFFLTSEADLEIVESIVAPLFVANLGKDLQENGSLYLKVSAIFSFVLFSNLRGRIPYGDTATSSLILTFWVAFAVFGSLLTLRIRKHGINYFFSLFRPSGCPIPLIFLLIPIEFLSYSFRVVSLSVRLFANRRAGHTLRKVLIGFSYVRFTLGEGYAIAAFLPALVVFVLIFLERAVAGIQAYIFTILICIYLKDLYVSH